MERSRISTCVSLFFLFFPPFFPSWSFAQSFETEVQRLERIAGVSSSPAKERGAAYIQMAKIFQLAGNIERACAAWTNAAFVDKNQRDDKALLEAALCHIAMGQFDKANANIRMVLVLGKTSALTIKARYLAAAIEAFHRLDTAPLIALLSDSAYAVYRSSIYYIIWRISGNNTYRAKLLAEYPKSPDALAVKEDGQVSAFPSALWLFLDKKTPILSSTAERGMLQAGFFSKEENAQSLVKELKRAGFDAELNKKTANGKIGWLVLVPTGENSNKTISQLKANGFEAFPG
jgi:hypothetical protein